MYTPGQDDEMGMQAVRLGTCKEGGRTPHGEFMGTTPWAFNGYEVHTYIFEPRMRRRLSTFDRSGFLTVSRIRCARC